MDDKIYVDTQANQSLNSSNFSIYSFVLIIKMSILTKNAVHELETKYYSIRN